MAVGHEGRDQLAEESRGAERGPRGQGDVHVQPLRAGSLGDRRDPEPLQRVPDPPGDVDHGRERHARHGIEVERGVVGVVEGVDAGEPRVLGDDGELGGVEQRQERAADETARHRAVDGQGLHAHAGRHGLRGALLVEALALHAVGEAPHDQRAVGEGGQEQRGDPRVVAHQLALGDACRGPQDLGEVRDLEALPVGERDDAVASRLFERGQLIDDAGEGRRQRGGRRDHETGRRRGAA